MNIYSELETFLKNYFKKLEIEFTEVLKTHGVIVSLSSGASVNNNGIGGGWLSCSSGNPGKEALHLTVDFKLNEINTCLDCGIYWTDGSFVEELADFDIGSSKELTKLIFEVEKSLNKIQEKALSRYLINLIENIDDL